MTKFQKNRTPWNKDIPTTITRCKDCGAFIGKDGKHVCKCVDKKGIRLCVQCGTELRNDNWERYSKICRRCSKIIQRENERILRNELINQFGGKCKKCEYDKVKECLEFHHLCKEDKKNKHFLKDVQMHPERFDLLCNRCHREIHVELKNEQNVTQIEA